MDDFRSMCGLDRGANLRDDDRCFFWRDRSVLAGLFAGERGSSIRGARAPFFLEDPERVPVARHDRLPLEEVVRGVEVGGSHADGTRIPRPTSRPDSRSWMASCTASRG